MGLATTLNTLTTLSRAVNWDRCFVIYNGFPENFIKTNPQVGFGRHGNQSRLLHVPFDASTGFTSTDRRSEYAK